MKILYYEEPRGKSLCSVHGYEICTNLLKLEHDVRFVKGAPSKPGTESWAKTGIGLSTWKYTQKLPLKYFKGELTLLWLLWCEVTTFFSILVLILKNKAKHEQEFDVIYRRHNLVNSEYLLAKLFKIPLVKEVNGIITNEMQLSKALLWLVGQIEKRNMSKAYRHIVVTSQLKKLLQSKYNIPEDKIHVVWNGANTELFKPTDNVEAKNQLGLRQDNSYICFVGSLSHRQGIEYLIKSAPTVLSSCPYAHFIIVGDGLMRDKIINLTVEENIRDKFTFTSFIPYETIPFYINTSDVCVAPYITERHEQTGASPLKLCEYMACEKPVVASAISGLEILEDYNAGILVLSESTQELANAIIRLLQNPELRLKMGKNGRRYVVENRSWELAAQSVAQVCQQVINQTPRGKDA